MVPVIVPLKILSPSPRLSMMPCPVQLTVAWPAWMVVASATQKSPMLMTSRVTVGMMDCLNRMTTPFIYWRRQSRHYFVGVHCIFPPLIAHEGQAREGEDIKGEFGS